MNDLYTFDTIGERVDLITMHTLEFSDQDIVHLIIALQRYNKALLEEEQDAGPSFSDSLRVENLLRRLRAINEADENPTAN